MIKLLSKKRKFIDFYNISKTGVDCLDQKCEVYSVGVEQEGGSWQLVCGYEHHCQRYQS